MLRIPIPFTDLVLLLSPALGGLPPLVRYPLLALMILGPLALLIWLYRNELKLIHPGWAAGLFLLRAGVFLSLLFVLGFDPVLSRTISTPIPGEVLLAVDRSDSMGTADPQRTPAEKFRLARALNLAFDLTTAEQLDAWAKLADAGSRPVDPKADEVMKRVDGMSRSRIARAVLGDGGKLLAAMQEKLGKENVNLVGFSQRGGPLTPDEVASLGDSPAVAGGAFTDLKVPLESALARPASDRLQPLGVVVLTDGQHNWGAGPVAKAKELGERGLPVYAVPLGPKAPPPDVAVVSVQSPGAVFKNADANVEARVQVAGLPAREITVTLNAPGQPPLEEKLRHDGTDHVYTVRFRPRMETVGTQVLTVTAKATPGEIRDDNNARPITVNVADDKAKVLLVDGEARWEFHYLASALERDKTMKLTSVVFAQPRVGKVSEEDLLKFGNPNTKLPTDPDALLAYDCVILGDTTPDQLPLADRQRLEKFVSERGGTLVILAGKQAMPLSFVRDKEGATDPLARLLPILDPKAYAPKAGFPMRLTAEGRAAAFLSMEATAEESDARWAGLPKHFWGVTGQAKPGAITLAYAADDVAGLDAAARIEREKANALVARHSYGFGRVLFVGLDSTWRWRYRSGDTYHHRFWSQVIRWAASDKPLVGGNESVRFGTRSPLYRQGEEVDLVARLGDPVRRLDAGAMTAARVFKLGEAGTEESVAVVPLARNDQQPRELDGKVRDLLPGTYAIELVIPELADQLTGMPGTDGKVRPLRTTFTVAPPDSAEMSDLGTNWTLLEEMAGRSGGRVFAPEEAAELVKLLQQKTAARTDKVETVVRQWWPLLLLFVVLLTLEWVGRKWAGLP